LAAQGDQLIQEVVGKVRGLDEELAEEADKSQFDVRKVTRLVELLHYCKHFDEVQPVTWQRRRLWVKWLVEDKFADKINRKVLWMKHSHVQDLDDLIDEHGQHASIRKAQRTLDTVSPVEGLASSLVFTEVVESMLDKEER